VSSAALKHMPAHCRRRRLAQAEVMSPPLASTGAARWMSAIQQHRPPWTSLSPPASTGAGFQNPIKPQLAQAQLGHGLAAVGGPPDAGAPAAGSVGQHTVQAKHALQGRRPHARGRRPQAAQAGSVAVGLRAAMFSPSRWRSEDDGAGTMWAAPRVTSPGNAAIPWQGDFGCSGRGKASPAQQGSRSCNPSLFRECAHRRVAAGHVQREAQVGARPHRPHQLLRNRQIGGVPDVAPFQRKGPVRLQPVAAATAVRQAAGCSREPDILQCSEAAAQLSVLSCAHRQDHAVGLTASVAAVIKKAADCTAVVTTASRVLVQDVCAGGAPVCWEVMPASRRAETEVKSRKGRVKRPSCADTPALEKMRSVVSRRYGFHASLQFKTNQLWSTITNVLVRTRKIWSTGVDHTSLDAQLQLCMLKGSGAENADDSAKQVQNTQAGHGLA